jgi:hypothetical protein
MRRSIAFSLVTMFLVVVCAAENSPARPLLSEPGEDFRLGTWAVEVDASYITPIRFSRDKFYEASVLASYYFGDDVSIGAELQGYYVDQPEKDAAILGGGPYLRWHFYEAERFSLFVDAGVGASIADRAVPAGGTHFNWTGKGGVGATVELRERVHLVGGARFFHISNGNLHGRDQNPSQDGIQGYVGVMFTF